MSNQARDKIFWSHPKADEPFVRALVHRLSYSGFDVFPDLWDVKGVEPVPKEIEAALSQCNWFFYALSPAAVESKWLRGDYYALLYSKVKHTGLRIIPLVRGTCPSPPLMAPLQHIDFRGFNLSDPAAFRTDKEGPFKVLMETLGRRYQKTGAEPIPPGFAVYEFTYQPRKGKPKNFDSTLNYELILRNVKKEPLKNFAITVRFKNPVVEVAYDKYRSSSAELGTGEGLSTDGKRFNWIVETFYAGGGFLVFRVRSRGVPEIERLSTKVVGRVAGTNRVIPPDPMGV